MQTIKQDTENVSEKSSVKRRVEERIKEFEIEFERKLQIERAYFDRKRLELEMQMKELEMQHQLRQKERVTFQLDPKRERCLGVGEFDERHANINSTKSSLRRQP